MKGRTLFGCLALIGAVGSFINDEVGFVMCMFGVIGWVYSLMLED